MTNAQCLCNEEILSAEDMALGMVIARVADDFGIEVESVDYIPLYHKMKEWLLSEKEK